MKSFAAPRGMRETMLMKMMIDMPLPMPRAVMSSPSHMTVDGAGRRGWTMMSATRHQVRLGSASYCAEQEDVADRLHERRGRP